MHTLPPCGERMRKGPHLKVVKELFEGHLLTIRLQPLYLKAIPQRPLSVIVLWDKKQASKMGATRGSILIILPAPLMQRHAKQDHKPLLSKILLWLLPHPKH